MPKYFFNCLYGSELVRDDDGTELPDDSAARKLGLESVRELLADAVKSGHRAPDALVISGEDERPIVTIPMMEALPK